MLQRGNTFLKRLHLCRGKIVKLATKFIADNSVRFSQNYISKLLNLYFFRKC